MAGLCTIGCVVSAEPELTGALLEGRYRVDGLLAVGGMSRVYRGTDVRLDRAVAVKVMDPRLADDPAFRNRFEREARAIARIDHPNVVDVYDQGEHGEPPHKLVYLAMEFVPGGTLRDVLIQRGALSVPEVLAVAEPVLAGLAEAHAQGLAHRDVKPENVLISPSGAVKVADFGLVMAAAQARTSTAGVIIGTVAYLSPEQVTGGDIDARSDVYAAGVMLFELLTGAPPFGGEHALTVAYQHVNEDVPPPSARVGGIPPDLDALVTAATRRDPRARPPDAGAMLHALMSVRASAGIPRVPVPVPTTHVEQPAVPGRRATRAYTTAGPEPGDQQTTAVAGADEPTQIARPGEPGWTDAGPPDHLRRRRRGRQAMAAWVGGVVVAGMFVAAIAWNAGVGHWTTVPTVVGMDQARATRAVQDAGLVAQVQQRHDNTMPAGRIVSEDPGPTGQAARGSTVQLVVSSGRPVVPVISPGTTVAQAQQILLNSDLSAAPTTTSAPDPTTPSGAVVGTSPAAGTRMNVGTPVTLVVSSGPERHRHHRGDDSDDSGGDDLRNSIVDRIEEGLRHAFGDG
jgi:eukaryotic-like serine/threonine-protein kinase